MTCDKCKYFHILCMPLRMGELWDMGRAKCDKHNLITDFVNYRKIKHLNTCDDFESQESEDKNDFEH